MMEHRITRIFVLLESIDFSKMRDEFESASACKKIEAGGNALNIALDIVRQYGPTNVIDADVFELLIPVLYMIARVAVDETLYTIPEPP
ncbi:MAG TPA: hypothetical protein VL996_00100 [Methylocella sp.]|nr:hypothetical protein [Methylocella sp.]